MSPAIYRADTEAALAVRAELSAVNLVLDHVAAMRKSLSEVLTRSRSDARWAHQHAALVKQAHGLDKQLSDYEDALWNPHTQHQVEEDFLRHFSRLHLHVESLFRMTAGLWGEKPSAQMLALIAADRSQVDQLLTRYNGSLLSQVKRWNSAAYAAGVGTLPTGMSVRLRNAPALPPAAGS